jgi:DNA-binding CsgD family transcriptional regulator
MENYEKVSSVLEAIYEDAAGGSQWNNILERMQAVLSSQRVILQVTNQTCSFSYFYAKGEHTNAVHISEWEHWSKTRQIDLNLFPGKVRIFQNPSEMSSDSIFLKMARKYKVGPDLSVRVQISGDENIDLHAIRADSARPFERDEINLFKIIVPHMARAMDLRKSLLSAQAIARVQGQELARIGIGGVLIGRHGVANILNDLTLKIFDKRDGLKLNQGRIQATDYWDNRRLSIILKKMIEMPPEEPQTRHSPAGAMQIKRRPGNRPLSLLVRPYPLQAAFLNDPGPGILILIRDPEARNLENAQIYRALFELTPMEASIANQLVNGLSLNEIQQHFSIKMPTLRSHIRSMFLKTGVNRQSDLIRVFFTMGAF